MVGPFIPVILYIFQSMKNFFSFLSFFLIFEEMFNYQFGLVVFSRIFQSLQISILSTANPFKYQSFQISILSNFNPFKFQSFQISILSNFNPFKFQSFQISILSWQLWSMNMKTFKIIIETSLSKSRKILKKESLYLLNYFFKCIELIGNYYKMKVFSASLFLKMGQGAYRSTNCPSNKKVNQQNSLQFPKFVYLKQIIIYYDMWIKERNIFLWCHHLIFYEIYIYFFQTNFFLLKQTLKKHTQQKD